MTDNSILGVIRETFSQEIASRIGTHIPGTHVSEKEWDILCVLDGCRFDAFQAARGQLTDSIWSVGSTSHTWIPQTFNDERLDLPSTAYVTGNPYSDRIDTDSLGVYYHHPVERIDDIETVPPTPLTNTAIRTWRRREEYGIDQMVVHFMQPHVPFRSAPELFEEYRGEDGWGSGVWTDVGDTIDRAEFFDAYLDNLKWVLEDGVMPLTRNADATIAVTADHGNAAGEWGYHGHPTGCPVPAVRRVPWETFEAVDERQRTPDRPSATDPVEDQLKALGYA